MEIQQVLDIIKEFFNAILKVFEALGIIKPKAEEGTGNEPSSGGTEA